MKPCNEVRVVPVAVVPTNKHFKTDETILSRWQSGLSSREQSQEPGSDQGPQYEGAQVEDVEHLEMEIDQPDPQLKVKEDRVEKVQDFGSSVKANVKTELRKRVSQPETMQVTSKPVKTTTKNKVQGGKVADAPMVMPENGKSRRVHAMLYASEGWCITSPQAQNETANSQVICKRFWLTRSGCFACGDVAAAHYNEHPGKCPNLGAWTNFVEGKSCPLCLQSDHHYFNHSFECEVEQIRKKERWPDLLTSRVGNCAVAFSMHPRAMQFRADTIGFCDHCWLCHKRGTGECSVQRHVVRNVLQTVWFHPKLRCMLLEEERVEKESWSNWGEFMRWALYDKGPYNLRNVDLVALFLNDLSEDKKRELGLNKSASGEDVSM